MGLAKFAKAYAVIGLVLVTVSATVTIPPAQVAASSTASASPATPSDVRTTERCVGAPATWTKGCSFSGEKLLQSANAAEKDRPNVYADQCWNFAPRFHKRTVCSYGNKKNPTLRIAVVGNSHAGHWVPAMLPILKSNKTWRVDTYLLSSCYTVNAKININEAAADSSTPEACRRASIWSVDSAIRGKYDLVIMSNRTATAPLSGVAAHKQAATAQAHYTRVLSTLDKGGIRTMVLRDTPHLATKSPACVRAHPNDWRKCSTAKTHALEVDPLAEAARKSSSPIVRLFDPTTVMCSGSSCPAVVGGLVARFDNSHMTHSFSQSFAPRLNLWIKSALASGPRVSVKKPRRVTTKIRQTKVLKVRVKNLGNSSAKLKRLKVRGSGFTLLKSSECKKNRQLRAKRSCIVRVRFLTKSKKTKIGTLEVRYPVGGRTEIVFVRLAGVGR